MFVNFSMNVKAGFITKYLMLKNNWGSLQYILSFKLQNRSDHLASCVVEVKACMHTNAAYL